MSSSPYISQTLRNYLTKFQIESLINTCVNSLCKEMPTDPYSYIANTFQKNASSGIQIIKITSTQAYNMDMIPVLSIRAHVRYMEKDVTISIDPIGIVNDQPVHLYDEDRLNGKGLNKGIQFIEEINSLLKDKICSNQKQIDNILISAYETKQSKGLYQINILSYLPCLITSKILNIPPFQVFRNLFGTKISSIKVCINVLQGSKLVNSKCKPYKFMIICEQLTDPFAIVNIVQSIKKSITSGKGGEAALKYAPDGTFICPVDTISDNLKIVQQAINSNSANTKDKFTIGISWMADNFYNPDQKKYQLQNPKALLDTDQLIEYYFKLSNDRPLLTYIEDPVFSKDPIGWNKLVKKFQNSKIKVGSRKLFSTIQQLKQNIPITKQQKPQLQQAQITQANSKKFKIASHWYRPFELITLSKLVDISKQLKRQQAVMILNQNHIETTDTTLVDLCYATGSYINLSCPLKFNQTNKLNRILQILKQ